MKKELPISLLNTTREVASGMHMPASGQAFSSSNAEDGEALIGGVGDSKTPKDFDIKDLREGTKVEMEHTNDRRIAREIAMDHLTEDPLYYKKLKKIEARANRILRKNALGLLDVPGGMGGFVDPEVDPEVDSDDSEVMGFRGIPQNPGLAQESEEYDGETTPFLKGRGDSGEDYNIEELPPINNDIDKRGSENSMLKDLVELKIFLEKSGKVKKAESTEKLIRKFAAGLDNTYLAYSKTCRWIGNRRLSAYGMDNAGKLWIFDADDSNPYQWWTGEHDMEKALNENWNFNQTGDHVWGAIGGGGTMPFKDHFPLIQNLCDAYNLLLRDYQGNQGVTTAILKGKKNYCPEDPAPEKYNVQGFNPRDDVSQTSVIRVEARSIKWPGARQYSMYGIGIDGQLYTSEGGAAWYGGGSNYPVRFVLNNDAKFSQNGDYGREWFTGQTNLYNTAKTYKEWLNEATEIATEDNIIVNLSDTTDDVIKKLYNILIKQEEGNDAQQFIIASKKIYAPGPEDRTDSEGPAPAAAPAPAPAPAPAAAPAQTTPPSRRLPSPPPSGT